MLRNVTRTEPRDEGSPRTWVVSGVRASFQKARQRLGIVPRGNGLLLGTADRLAGRAF